MVQNKTTTQTQNLKTELKSFGPNDFSFFLGGSPVDELLSIVTLPSLKEILICDRESLTDNVYPFRYVIWQLKVTVFGLKISFRQTDCY
jgi:hypothetical protein